MSRDQGRAGRSSLTPWRALNRAQDFRSVYEAGVKHVGRLFVLYLYPGDDLARSVVASRKVGNAVCRNRAKRLLREALRQRIESQPGRVDQIRSQHWNEPTASGLWLVAVARRRILEAGCGDVIAELDHMFQRSSPDQPVARRNGESLPGRSGRQRTRER